jgi:UDP-N-acetylmuramate--alanine ligase
MNLSQINSIYFLGIGGIGMSALARYFNFEGKQIAGYDRTATPLTEALQNEGIRIHFEERIDLIPADTELVIYTPAIPKDNQEFVHLQKSGIPMLKRSEILGEICKNYFTIAIAGTHGKTTITSMVTQLLKHNGIAVNAFIGGIANNFNSNLVLSKNAKVMVVEADEFDRSFLTLHPDMAIISAMDADHLDIYDNAGYLKESFFLFSEQVRTGGWLIHQAKLETSPRFNGKRISYAANSTADYYAGDIRIENGNTVFQLYKNGKAQEQFHLSMPGNHNVENATAAIVAASVYGLEFSQIADALANYTGVQRRFQFIIRTENRVMIDDYAHHPEEIKASIQAARSLYPDRKLTVVFQPHLYSRTRDFMDDFAESLSAADELILLDIYPAREKPIAGITSAALLEKVRINNKRLCSKEELPEKISALNPEVLIMMGAGDIDRLVKPVKEKLLTR